MTTDHYSQCENGLVALLRTMTDIFPHPWQVTDDEAALMRGGANRIEANNFFIVRPGPFPNTTLSTTESMFQWVIVSDLYVRFKEKAQSLRDFKAVRAAVIEKIFTNPTLDRASNVQKAEVESDELVQFFRFDPEAQVPNFVIQTMRVSAIQLVEWNI